jgi:hypothetical protein
VELACIIQGELRETVRLKDDFSSSPLESLGKSTRKTGATADTVIYRLASYGLDSLVRLRLGFEYRTEKGLKTDSSSVCWFRLVPTITELDTQTPLRFDSLLAPFEQTPEWVLAALIALCVAALGLVILLGWPVVRKQWRLMLANREWASYRKVLTKAQKQEKTRLEDLQQANLAWASFLELRLRKHQLLPPLLSLRALTPTELQPTLSALVGGQTVFSLQAQPFLTLSRQEYESAFLRVGISPPEVRAALTDVIQMLDGFNRQTALP